MKNIVSMRWLLARIYEPDVFIADCGFLLGQPVKDGAIILYCCSGV
ncbi:MAG: hypothetical protein ACE3K2_17295 [Paenibacillus sp.]